MEQWTECYGGSTGEGAAVLPLSCACDFEQALPRGEGTPDPEVTRKGPIWLRCRAEGGSGEDKLQRWVRTILKQESTAGWGSHVHEPGKTSPRAPEVRMCLWPHKVGFPNGQAAQLVP